jgi:hypothetical protein
MAYPAPHSGSATEMADSHAGQWDSHRQTIAARPREQSGSGEDLKLDRRAGGRLLQASIGG